MGREAFQDESAKSHLTLCTKNHRLLFLVQDGYGKRPIYKALLFVRGEIIRFVY